jgi:heat-inducible transcriptional repressor
MRLPLDFGPNQSQIAAHDPRCTARPPGAISISDLQKLNERSRTIFREIVESYLATGEAVGSRNLARHLPMTLSPASVRNVMSDLEHLGLIYAPHTSAGRLPTETGLRLFVDGLLEVGDLTEDERRAIEAQIGVRREKAFEQVLTEAGEMISGLSHCAGVVLADKQVAKLKHVEFVALEPGKALVVMVGEDQDVENRVITLPPGLPPSSLVEATNYLNARIRGLTLVEAKARIEREQATAGRARRPDPEGDRRPASRHLVGRARRQAEPLIVRGQANLLRTSTGSTTWSASPAVRRPGDQARPGAAAGPGRARRRGAYLHRLGEQAVLALGLLRHRRPVQGRAAQDRGRAGRDRADAPQLCPHHPDGGLHGQAHRSRADLIFSPVCPICGGRRAERMPLFVGRSAAGWRGNPTCGTR